MALVDKNSTTSRIMSIFVVPGVSGEIKTTTLPSGDMAVFSPSVGVLERLTFDVCRWSGKQDKDYGWIVPRAHAGRVLIALKSRCNMIAD